MGEKSEATSNRAEAKAMHPMLAPTPQAAPSRFELRIAALDRENADLRAQLADVTKALVKSILREEKAK